MRMIESGGARKWPSSKDAPTFGSPLKNLTAEQLGLLLKECRINGDPTCTMPSRSGSAPPSIEGSFAAIENLFAQQNFRTSPSLESLNNGIENYEIEEQLRSDPVYFAYYWSNVNLNPQLPPPLPSRENQRLAHHISGFGNSRRSSLDDSSNKSSQFLRGSLSTHKEEAEDDRSPREASENVSVFLSGQASFLGRPKSLVDLIQEDFPRTPSPVYSQSRSSSHTTDEMIDHDAHAISSNVPSSNISKIPESNSGSSDVCGDAYAFENAARVISVDSPSTTTFTSSLQLDGVPILLKDELSIKPTGSESDTLINVQSSSARLDSRVRNKQGEQQAYGKNITQHHASSQQGNSYQAPLTSHAMNHSFGGMEKFPHSHPKFSFEGHSSFSTPTLNPPLYSPAGGYMTAGTSFYPNFQHSGLYSPQYSMGGYPFGSAYLPPFMTSYPSHGSIPMLYSTSSGPSLDGRTAGASSGQNVPHLGALLHVGKFYGQQGLMLQPPVLDPLHLQYVPYPYGDAYYTTVQHNRLPSSGASGSQIESFAARMESAVTAYADDKKLEPPTNGGFGIPSPGKLGIGGGTYYGGPPSMGMMTQFPVSPHTSPVLPSSPVGWRNNMRFPEVSSRNAGVYSGGHGQRGFNTFDDPKRHQFLEELKSNSGQKFELSDIVGRIVEFSVDQHGSRFIQQKLEHCSVEDKASVFKEVLPHASKLMTDVFGNYVIQKFFEHGTPEQRKELANKLSGQMVQLSMQMYGCRVIQKALEVIDVDQKALLVQELDGHVMRCVRDQNGNHVIQKCIECVAPEDIEFIISAFRGQVATLSTHPYGCRVIQRVLEHCPDEHQSQYIVNEILESAYLLAQNQYGNYVTQHVLERGKLQERSQIIDNLTGKFVEMSQHKYASNVVEKCLEHGDASQQELLIDEIIEQSEESLLAMMKDQFANYVIQKILEKCSDKQREILVNRIRAHLNALKKYTYGKHIVARFEQLCGEESQTLES